MTPLAQDYSALDVPEVLLRLFHPQPESALFTQKRRVKVSCFMNHAALRDLFTSRRIAC
jgi:hypothetical protein